MKKDVDWTKYIFFQKEKTQNKKRSTLSNRHLFSLFVSFDPSVGFVDVRRSVRTLPRNDKIVQPTDQHDKKQTKDIL